LKIDEAAPVWCSGRWSDNHHPTPTEKSRFMKSVVQTQRQGKMKDVSVSAAASGLPAGEIETKVALIQALIPLGPHAVGEAFEVEVVETKCVCATVSLNFDAGLERPHGNAR